MLVAYNINRLLSIVAVGFMSVRIEKRIPLEVLDRKNLTIFS